MSIFILVHGAWHGSWCWKYVVPLLQKEGHKAIVPDLPGSGEDFTPIKDITLSLYVKKILDLIKAQDENVVLVGHSMGGIVISEVAERVPNKISSLVYLCAFMPKNNQSLMDIVQDNPNPYLQLELAKDFSYSRVKDESIDIAFFNDCDQEDIKFARSLLKPQSSVVFQTKVSLSEENYGRIPRVYIECTNDNAISIELQRSMIKEQPLVKLYSIDTDHSPFFSTPKILGKILNEIEP